MVSSVSQSFRSNNPRLHSKPSFSPANLSNLLYTLFLSSSPSHENPSPSFCSHRCYSFLTRSSALPFWTTARYLICPPHMVPTLNLVSVLLTWGGLENVNLAMPLFHLNFHQHDVLLQYVSLYYALGPCAFEMTLAYLYCFISPVCFKITGVHLIKFLDIFKISASSFHTT